MKVVCNGVKACGHERYCNHRTEHEKGGGCGSSCWCVDGVPGATCSPVPTDLTYPLRPPRGFLAEVRCDTADECGSDSCGARLPHPRYTGGDHCATSYHCGTAGAQVRCNPVPEPAKPHGVAFKGTASQLFRYLGGLTDERFNAMMHVGITIDTTPDLVADALRVQEDANGEGVTEREYERKVKTTIHSELLFPDEPHYSAEETAIAAARIVKLPRP